MFQKRHYEKMALELRESILDMEEKRSIAFFLCNVFKSDNPLFRREQFLTACGIIGGGK